MSVVKLKGDKQSLEKKCPTEFTVAMQCLAETELLFKSITKVIACSRPPMLLSNWVISWMAREAEF